MLEFWKHLDEKSLSMNSGSCFTKETSWVRVDSELAIRKNFLDLVWFSSFPLPCHIRSSSLACDGS